jgi:His-Xaa-Ser system protein HxsD
MNEIPSIDLANKAILVVSSNTYSMQNLENASYKFTGFASFNFTEINSEIKVEIEALPNAELTANDVYHLLKNQLLSESLRQKIADQTQTERNLILAYAFSNTALVK